MDLGELFLRFIEQYHDVLRGADEAEMKSTGLPDISIHQFFYLQEIRRQHTTTLTELAKALHITKSSATAIVTKLINEGFVSRTKSKDDKRIYFLTLTEKGHQVFRHKEMAYKKFIDIIAIHTTKEEQKILENAFRIIINVFSNDEYLDS